MRVLLLSRYGHLGPSSRLRHYQFLPELAARGMEVDVAPLLPDRYLSMLYGGGGRSPGLVAQAYLTRLRAMLSVRRYDLVWIEKEILPWLPYPLERLLLAGVPYVVDFDDAWFHKYDRHRSGAVRALLGDKLDRLMSRAALVTVGNDYLGDRARRAGARRILTLPTVVDLNRYPLREPVAGPTAGKERVTIGWIGSPSTSPYLDLVRGPLEAIVAKGMADLVLIGAAKETLAGLPVRRLDWTEASEVSNIQSFDIGIMPLADTPWERGKCGYKLIQYMACGRPVVASPVGVNTSIVEHGVNGFLADTEAEWLEALGRLCAEPGLREAAGAAGRAKVEQRYCVERLAPQLIDGLRVAAGKG